MLWLQLLFSLFYCQAENSLDKEEPAEENYVHEEIYNKKPVQDTGDMGLNGNAVTNAVGQIHSPPREGVKFSGIFLCGWNVAHFVVCWLL